MPIPPPIKRQLRRCSCVALSKRGNQAKGDETSRPSARTTRSIVSVNPGPNVRAHAISFLLGLDGGSHLRLARGARRHCCGRSLGDGETPCLKVRSDEVRDGPSWRSQAAAAPCGSPLVEAVVTRPTSTLPRAQGLTRLIAPTLYKNFEFCRIATIFSPVLIPHSFCIVCRFFGRQSAAVHLAERRLVWRLCRPPPVHRASSEHQPVLIVRMPRWFPMEGF